jgi:hypothetical protein
MPIICTEAGISEGPARQDRPILVSERARQQLRAEAMQAEAHPTGEAQGPNFIEFPEFPDGGPA